MADPTPESESTASHPSGATGQGALTAAQRADLLRAYAQHDDKALGGLDTAQKFLDRSTVEYGLWLAARGDLAQKARVLRALDGARELVDPIWGGVYQYSTGGNWKHPHHEKLMRVQGRYLRLYAQAFSLWHRAEDRDSAGAIARYMLDFLRDGSGAFYVSQDADVVPGQKVTAYFQLDDAARRRVGVPDIDMHLYADANGQAISALAYYADVSGDAAALDAAVKAAEWMQKNLALGKGGFRHDAGSTAGPYLSDTLAMGEAFLALHRSTGERRWLAAAEEAAAFIVGRFESVSGGFESAVQGTSPVKPVANIDENVTTTRYMNLLQRYTGDAAQRNAARHGMKFLTGAGVVGKAYEEAGILLADAELSSDPVHATVVGAKGDALAMQLFAAARAVAAAYARVEWWDRAEGPLKNLDVTYPAFPKAAGYVCSEGRCSAPSFSGDIYRDRVLGALARL